MHLYLIDTHKKQQIVIKRIDKKIHHESWRSRRHTQITIDEVFLFHKIENTASTRESQIVEEILVNKKIATSLAEKLLNKLCKI